MKKKWVPLISIIAVIVIGISVFYIINSRVNEKNECNLSELTEHIDNLQLEYPHLFEYLVQCENALTYSEGRYIPTEVTQYLPKEYSNLDISIFCQTMKSILNNSKELESNLSSKNATIPYGIKCIQTILEDRNYTSYCKIDPSCCNLPKEIRSPEDLNFQKTYITCVNKMINQTSVTEIINSTELTYGYVVWVKNKIIELNTEFTWKEYVTKNGCFGTGCQYNRTEFEKIKS